MNRLAVSWSARAQKEQNIPNLDHCRLVTEFYSSEDRHTDGRQQTRMVGNPRSCQERALADKNTVLPTIRHISLLTGLMENKEYVANLIGLYTDSK